MSRDFDPPLPTAQVPRPPMQAWVDERTRVAVARNTNIAGKLIFQEPVRIEGKFRGEVSSVELLVVAAEATIEGKIRAPRLLILGEVRGDVIGAAQVVLGPAARVNGRIQANSLTICEGAQFTGEVQMQTQTDATASAPSPRIAPA
jgi:cytoskeletal protein CcmA (bactofilin family)